MSSAEFIYNLGYEAGANSRWDDIHTASSEGERTVWKVVKDLLKDVKEMDEAEQVLWQIACSYAKYDDEKGADNE